MNEILDLAAPAVAAPPDETKMAATSVGLTKIYGEGNTKVVALDNIDIEIATCARRACVADGNVDHTMVEIASAHLPCAVHAFAFDADLSAGTHPADVMVEGQTALQFL